MSKYVYKSVGFPVDGLRSFLNEHPNLTKSDYKIFLEKDGQKYRFDMNWSLIIECKDNEKD